MNNGDIIKFNVKKNFTYIKSLGSGGTGDTHLFKDETTEMFFAIKKYVPKDDNFIEEYYERFVDEIKILFNISHPNIVRIYNYYLYPNKKTGFLQMEYIEGMSIDQFKPDGWGKDWNDIFREVISAFEYLENNHILHRDIRPANILIDNNDCVKIIDFGFGKQFDNTKKEKNSVLLNWPVTNMPNEIILNEEYNERTEIYFVGTLFRHLLQNYDENFRFNHIIEKMIKINPEQRYSSFTEIMNDISVGVLEGIDFSDKEKSIYRKFASELTNHINYYLEKYSPVNNTSTTLNKLATIIRNSSLESHIQNNSQLIQCFINGGFGYNTKSNIDVKNVIDFYDLVTRLPSSKQEILFNNIYNRLSTIKIKVEDDDLPF
ncbi:MAG: protein kinase family protein [Acutalibacteraceae bacterium]|nr:protein kinase family protein [Acutalibacteraceae bacterium]